ncbi:GNAT family N-acetyltransferase [Bacillus sp. V33-4]|uniref:GNAT family N-acetyltransferase n=1 Tax=Bacillus sp. V33-4 TaxID=2054169 RepID=UPI000C757913|nr:N-acetyltransferase [Bacillus sp. V33-4]PLR86702.1 GNAT family N-acetyltransferase [Bacillus sp. V33-4]
MNIRTEKASDYKKVYQLNYLAFGERDDESKLIERIRLSEEFVPELSIIAEEKGEIAGHILLSKAKVKNPNHEYEVIVLAPIAVRPGYQKKGIGTKLMQEGLRRCKGLGYGLVLLIGHPDYYPKFGFKPARKYRLELRQFDVPDEVFMVCELKVGELNKVHGELTYPGSFFG